MRSLFVLVALLFAASPHAAVVNFETLDRSLTCDSDGCGYHTAIVPEGFVFTAVDGVFGNQSADTYFIDTASGPYGSYLTTGSDYYPSGLTGITESPIAIAITHQSGLAFDVHSIDAFVHGSNFMIDAFRMIGYDDMGTAVASINVDPSLSPIPDGWRNLVLDDDWTGVYSVVIYHQMLTTVFSSDAAWLNPRIDNFSATVVPVPAALWLFLSGLVALGAGRLRNLA